MVATVLATDTVVKVRGRVKVDDDTVSVNASELTLPDIAEAPSGLVVISLPAVRCTPAVLERLQEVLSSHPGTTEVRVRLLKADGTLVARLPRHRVTPSPPLMADLKALLGPSCLAP
jgi:DNA polymerase-3 subunit alpha